MPSEVPLPAASMPVPAPAATTPARIAEHLAALDGLDALPLAEHAEIFHALHTQLQAALAEVDGQ